jgi:hypothetical protein
MSKPKAYIAGKISGLDYNDAFRKFEKAETLVASLGFEPVNPMKKNGLDENGNEHSWAEYMKRDIPHLLQCAAIVLLPCWKDSRGATLEEHIAMELELSRIEL